MSPNVGERRGVAGIQPMSTAVHRSPNKLRRSNSILIFEPMASSVLFAPRILQNLKMPKKV
jgi:hypothetical protein